MTHRLALWPLLATMACTSTITRDFETLHDRTMAPPAPLMAGWEPDATVRIDDSAVLRAVTAALEGAVLSEELNFGVVRVDPQLTTTRLALVAASPGCEQCVGITGTLSGSVRYKGMGLAGFADATVSLTLDAALDVADDGTTKALTARLGGLRDVSIRLGTGNRDLIRLISEPLSEWIAARVLSEVPEVRIARFGLADIPIHGVRVEPAEGALQLALRTTAPGKAATEDAPPVADGWSARVAVDSVLALARQQTFAMGAQAYGIWADPVDFRIDGDTFMLTLRLWKPKGGAWWREYEIVGDVTTARGKLSLVSHEVVELRRSNGAAAVDPLAALGRAQILEGLQAAVNAQIPASRAQDIGNVTTTWRIGTLTREGEDVVLRGKVTFDAVSR